ncbi:ankyrin repeat-containing domain protein [Flammula alnicola]|nr:ankyrin repeat-containing domain protein [Flammula alnicola]
MVYLSEIKNFGQISYPFELLDVLYSSSNPLLYYVYHHWGTHARSCRGENGLPTVLLEFLFSCSPYPWKDADISFDRFKLPHIASRYGLTEFLPQILQSHDKPTAGGRLPLHLCAMYGQDMIMQALLECHPEALNIKDREGNTALILACGKGHESAVKLLVSYDDIDLNGRRRFGKTPLLAVENGNLAITQLLVAHRRLNPDQQRGGVPHGTYPCILERPWGDCQAPVIGINVNAQATVYGKPALLPVASQSHCLEAIFEMLISRKELDVNQQYKWGRTALMVASLSWGLKEKSIKLLLSRSDLDVNKQDQDGNTTLIHASSSGYVEFVKLLLSRDDVDVNRRNEDGDTALVQPAINHHEAIIELLISCDKLGSFRETAVSRATAIHAAAELFNYG